MTAATIKVSSLDIRCYYTREKARMLIKSGKCPASEPWQILEVAMNQSPEVLALRLSKELKRLHAAAEVLIPMKRNAAGDCEWLIEHVYVRGLNGSLRQFARTPGIDSIRKETAPPEWIQQLQSEEDQPRPRLRRGAFVRLLTGPCA